MKGSEDKGNTYERLRNRILSAIFRQDEEAAVSCYREVFHHVESAAFLSEEEQKALNQIHAVLRKFGNLPGAARKVRVGESRKTVRRRMAGLVRSQVTFVQGVALEDWRCRLGIDERQYRALLPSVSSFQLTVGCTNACRRCNEWALPGVRKQFASQAAKQLLRDLFQAENSGFSLYAASDPLDWSSGKETIVDLLRFMKRNGFSLQYGLLTKVPKGTEEIAASLLKTGADFAVSVTDKNRSRIKWIEERVGKRFNSHHETADLAIPAGMDEDFLSIKPSITDNYGTEITPEGASLVVPTFTSALNPTGQCRMRVDADTRFFLERQTGRMALAVYYFKPLRALDLKGNPFVLEELLDPQVENILLDRGEEDLTPPGMMNLGEYFRTFDPEVVRQRKKLFPSVVKDLQQEILRTSFTGGDQKSRYRFFRVKVNRYLSTCRMAKVVELRKNTCCFFLQAIARYLQERPSEREVVRHLRRQDNSRIQKQYEGLVSVGRTDVSSLLERTDICSFDLFQILLLRLLENPADDSIRRYVENRVVAYDPESDLFLSQ